MRIVKIPSNQKFFIYGRFFQTILTDSYLSEGENVMIFIDEETGPVYVGDGKIRDIKQTLFEKIPRQTALMIFQTEIKEYLIALNEYDIFTFEEITQKKISICLIEIINRVDILDIKENLWVNHY